MSEMLEVGGLMFEVRRSARRRTFGLTVDRYGDLVLYAPTHVLEEDLSRWAHTKLLWVHQKLSLKETMAPKTREPEFVHGETFWYLGRPYRLVMVSEQDRVLVFDGRCFSLRRDATAHAAEHFRRWYIREGREWIVGRVEFLSRRTGISPAGVKLRDLGFRWGSCGSDDILRFNWRLLQMSIRLVDYVIVHELAHLLEPHHIPTFWHVLDRVMPDWKERTEELRTRVRDIYWCHSAMV